MKCKTTTTQKLRQDNKTTIETIEDKKLIVNFIRFFKGNMFYFCENFHTSNFLRQQ